MRSASSGRGRRGRPGRGDAALLVRDENALSGVRRPAVEQARADEGNGADRRGHVRTSAGRRVGERW